MVLLSYQKCIWALSSAFSQSFPQVVGGGTSNYYNFYYTLTVIYMIWMIINPNNELK